MLGDLVRQGFSVTGEHEDADAVIVNTCAFVEDAKAESIEAIIEAAALNEDGKRRRVVVTGCLAQRYSDSLAADLPEADLVVGFQVGQNASWGGRGAQGPQQLAPLRDRGALPPNRVSHGRTCHENLPRGLAFCTVRGAGPLSPTAPEPQQQPSACRARADPALPRCAQNYAQLGNSIRSSLGLEEQAGIQLPAPPPIDDPAEGPGLEASAPVRSRVQVGDATVPFRAEWDRVRLTPQHSAYLRVAEGCNHAVRAWRGGV